MARWPGTPVTAIPARSLPTLFARVVGSGTVGRASAVAGRR